MLRGKPFSEVVLVICVQFNEFNKICCYICCNILLHNFNDVKYVCAVLFFRNIMYIFSYLYCQFLDDVFTTVFERHVCKF